MLDASAALWLTRKSHGGIAESP